MGIVLYWHGVMVWKGCVVVAMRDMKIERVDALLLIGKNVCHLGSLSHISDSSNKGSTAT